MSIWIKQNKFISYIYIYIYIYIYGTSLKLVDKFTYQGSSVSSTEKDIDTRLTKTWTATDKLSIIWKSDLTDKMKRRFFQAAVVLILPNGCTTWTLTKQLEKKLDGNYTRMYNLIYIYVYIYIYIPKDLLCIYTNVFNIYRSMYLVYIYIYIYIGVCVYIYIPL